MTIDHSGFSVPPARYEEVIKFYLAALSPLGYTKQMDFEGAAVGLGVDLRSMDFWIDSKGTAESSGFHIAFTAKDHETVDKFYEESLKAGGKCNGKPGIRAHYHPNYYAAFIVDPVGNRIEVVDHLEH